MSNEIPESSAIKLTKNDLDNMIVDCWSRHKAADIVYKESLTICTECKGTGEYIGLFETEPCSVCKGAKVI